jgi:hypothetical protein
MAIITISGEFENDGSEIGRVLALVSAMKKAIRQLRTARA